jgi:hypothetical protein
VAEQIIQWAAGVELGDSSAARRNEELTAICIDVARAQRDGPFAVWQFRDRLDNGRKVAIEILEYFDGRGLTERRGDLPRLNPRRLDLQARPVDIDPVGLR